MLIDRIVKQIPVGTQIPKPQSKKSFLFKGAVRVANEQAITYSIPLKKKAGAAAEKRITASQLEKAYSRLCRTGEIDKSWWAEHVAASESEGGCNFTTFGGLMILLGEAERAGRGVYRHVK